MIDLTKYLPANLKNQFWIDFLDAVSEELELYKEERIDVLKDFYVLRNITDEQQLIDIAKSFGYTPDRSVDDSLDYLKLVVSLINYKVKYKTSYIGYDFIFKAINTLGYVYNLYIDAGKFIRGLNFEEVYNSLNAITDYSLPFLDYIPEFYYSLDVIAISTLDAGGTLDGIVPTLDATYDLNTTHYLSIDYTPFQLIIEDSVEYYMTNTYLEYLLTGSLYNKKTTEYPQCAYQFNLLLDTSGYFDNLSNAAYSTPALKLNCSTTNSSYYNKTADLFLDQPTGTDSNMDLDLEVPWGLDQTLPPALTGDVDFDFHEICFGDTNKGMLSKDFADINENLIAYWDFDEAGATFVDNTFNNYIGNLFGDYSYVPSNIGKSVKFNDTTGYGIVNNIILADSDKTISFWVKSEAPVTGTILEIDNLCKIDYIETTIGPVITKELSIDFIGNSSTANITIPFEFDEDYHLISLKIDKTGNLGSFYLDGVFNSSADISTIGVIGGSSNLYLGIDSTLTDSYVGEIEEIRIYSGLLDDTYINYLYTSLLGNIKRLGNEVYCSTDDITVRDDTDAGWYIVSGRTNFSVSSPFEPSELDEEVIIKEMGIKNQDGDVIAYASFPPAKFKKKFYTNFQWYIKRI